MNMKPNNSLVAVSKNNMIVKMKTEQLKQLVLVFAILNVTVSILILTPLLLSRIPMIANLIQSVPSRFWILLFLIYILVLISIPVLGIIILVKKAKSRYKSKEIMASTIMSIVACVALLSFYAVVIVRLLLALSLIIFTLGLILLTEIELFSFLTNSQSLFWFLFPLTNIINLIASGINFFAWHKMKQPKE